MAPKQGAVPSSAVMMQQSLNKLTGQVEWNVVRLHDDQDGTGASLTSSSFGDVFLILHRFWVTSHLRLLGECQHCFLRSGEVFAC